MANRSAPIIIHNRTGANFRFQVLHQYTGDPIEESPWIDVDDGTDADMSLTVHYRTGFGTTGVDNWIVNGIERRVMTAQFQGVGALAEIPLGAEFDLRWESGTGFGSDWKVHTLRSGDDGEYTLIKVYPTLVEFESPSGASSTGWYPEYDIFHL